MKEKQLPTCSSGFSFFAILVAFVFFLATTTASATSNTGTGTNTTTTRKSLPNRPRGIAAIPLTSQLHSAEERQQGIKNVQQAAGEEKVKCKTEQGNYVDWFIAYKLPKNRTSSNALVRAGLAYAYILPPQTRRHTTTRSPTTTVNISVNENASSNKGSFSGGHDNLNTYFSAGLTGKDLPSAAATKKATKSATTWILSNNGIDSPGSMVGQTLGKLYVKDNQDIAYLTYNDQPPVGPTVDSGGHSKGIIVASLASGGIWIQHSVPHFPLIDPNNYHYQYPATGKTNGQVFHCMSFSSAKDVDDLARIFEITIPHVVNFSFPTDSFKNALPQLMSIAHRHHRLEYQIENNQFPINNNLSIFNQSVESSTANDDKVVAEVSSSSPCLNEIDERGCLNGKLIGNKTPVFNQNEEAPNPKQNWDLIELHTTGGKILKAFAKGPSFNEDIYSSWIATTYKTKLGVQSWLNGPHPFASNCSSAQYSVYNILEKSIAGHVFSTHNDHSKWAMSLSGGGEQPLVCISDLNRMEHQLKRGGVSICFTDATVWLTFNSSIIDVQPCPRFLSGGGIVATTPINNMSSSLSSLREPGSIVPSPSQNIVLNAVSNNYENQTGGVQSQKSAMMMTSVSKDQRQRHFQRRKLQQKVKSRTYSLIMTI